MKVAISQPCFLPYYGYFELMKEADVFVYLDDVKFSRHSWQQRNIILINNKERWITIPVKHGEHYIKDCIISDVREVEKIRKSIKQHCKIQLPAYTGNNLCDLNIFWTEHLKGIMGIDTKTVRSSEFKKPEDRIEKLIYLCKQFKADEYIMTKGCENYFEDKDYKKFEEEGITVSVKDFAPGLSIVQELGGKYGLER